MAKISGEDLNDLEDILDRVGVRGLFEALVAVASEKESHVIQTWGDTALAKRWAKLADKFLKLESSIDDPYNE